MHLNVGNQLRDSGKSNEDDILYVITIQEGGTVLCLESENTFDSLQLEREEPTPHYLTIATTLFWF